MWEWTQMPQTATTHPWVPTELVGYTLPQLDACHECPTKC